MKIARVLLPMGEVILKADNDQAAQEFASHLSLSVLPEAERCQIPWLQVSPGTNPGTQSGTNPLKEQHNG